MPRQEHIVSVFVASPGDVIEERIKLEEVIKELNILWRRELGLSIDLIRWETHAYPSAGQDAQDVINMEIPDDYDVFIGILWHRFGTPTGRYGSGTIEEFERARGRSNSAGGGPKIMFYFKDNPPISISDINGEELRKVQEFKASLGAEGFLYWKYNDVLSFERYVRMHISKHIQEFARRIASNTIELKSAEKRVLSGDEEFEYDEEIGFFELGDAVDLHFAETTEIVSRINDYTSELGKKIDTHASEMKMQSSSLSFGKVSKNQAKSTIGRIALDLTQFSQRISAEIPLLSENMNKGIGFLIKSVELSTDFRSAPSYTDQMISMLAAAEGMVTATAEAQTGLEGFREAISSLPRLTTDLNRAKRTSVLEIDRLIHEIDAGRRLAIEAVAAVRSQIN